MKIIQTYIFFIVFQTKKIKNKQIMSVHHRCFCESKSISNDPNDYTCECKPFGVSENIPKKYRYAMPYLRAKDECRTLVKDMIDGKIDTNKTCDCFDGFEKEEDRAKCKIPEGEEGRWECSGNDPFEKPQCRNWTQFVFALSGIAKVVKENV